jgi:hypothetical protein
MIEVLLHYESNSFFCKTDRPVGDRFVHHQPTKMMSTPTMNISTNKNVFYQLARYFLCLILLVAALPFITLAGIFSLITDIPHIKIELGSDNVVESVYFKLTRDWTEEQPEDEDEQEEEQQDEEDGDEGEEVESGNEADDEDDDQPPVTPTRRLTGRFAEDDEPPVTPVRKISEVECPDAPRRPSAVEVDAGVITNRVRSPTNLNDSDLTQDHASSSEEASREISQPPSVCPPSS